MISLLLRLVFYSYNYRYFSLNTTKSTVLILSYGLFFDFIAVFYLNFILILLSLIPYRFYYRRYYQRLILFIFMLTNTLGIMVNLFDAMFYRFHLKRSTPDFFIEFKHTDLGAIFFHSLMTYWYIYALFMLLLGSMYYLFTRIKLLIPQLYTWKNFFGDCLLALIISFGLIILLRGPFILNRGLTFHTRPLMVNDASLMTDDSSNIPLIINTVVSVIQTDTEHSLIRKNYYPTIQLNQIYSPLVHSHSPAQFRAKNVVILIMESFAKHKIGFYNHQSRDTPFLDQLIAKSARFNYSFANSQRSIQGIPAVVASIPGSIDYISSPYITDKIVGLPKLLRDKGYTTAFFHGGHNGSMGLDSFAKLAGFQFYYGENEYQQFVGDDNKNNINSETWGIYDQPFEQFMLQQLNKMPQPFMVSLFTLSSHDPFSIPIKYKNKFNIGPSLADNSIAYADYALEQFFLQAKTESWYKNTLFVIVADHSAFFDSLNFKAKITPLSLFTIPIIFFDPSNDSVEFKGMENKLIQATDIMPTILDYLHYDGEYLAFGKSLFASDSRFIINAQGVNLWQYIEGDYLYQYNSIDDKAVGLYNYKNDPLFKDNLLKKANKQVKIMEYFLKAYIEQYNNRIIDNHLSRE